MQKRRTYVLKLAQTCSTLRITKHYFFILKHYASVRKKHKRILTKFHAIHSTVMLRKHWHRWLLAIQSCRVQKALDFTSLRYWASALQLKCFNLWIAAFQLTIEGKVCLTFAESHFNKVLVKKCISGWKTFLLERKKKKDAYRYADSLASLSTLRRFISIWYKALRLKQNEHSAAEAIFHHGLTATKRRLFRKWILYVADVRLQKLKEAHSDNFYLRKLKKKYINLLCSVLSKKKQLVSMVDSAKAFHVRCLVSSAWGLWLARCEDSEELKLYPMTRIARSYHK